MKYQPSEFRIAIAVYLLLAAIAVCCPGPEVEAESSITKPALIIAEGNGWTTTLVASSSIAASYDVSDCNGLIPDRQIPAGGTIVVRNLGTLQCTATTLGAILAPEGSIEGMSVLTYGTTAQFSVPPLRYAVSGTGKGEISRIINDGADSTFVVLLNRAEVPTVVTLDVINGAGVKIAEEYVVLPIGITFYRLTTPVSAGRLVIRQGVALYPGPFFGVVYAFAAIGPESGTSQRIEVMH